MVANALEFLGLDRAFYEEQGMGQEGQGVGQEGQGVGQGTEESEDVGPPRKQVKLVA